MEAIKLEIKSRELSRTLLTCGATKKIDCTRYWDSHGKRVKYEPKQYKFDEPKKFELIKVVREEEFPYTGTHVSEFWYLYVDGQKYDIGEIMSYQVLKTKLKLDICVGAG